MEPILVIGVLLLVVLILWIPFRSQYLSRKLRHDIITKTHLAKWQVDAETWRNYLSSIRHNDDYVESKSKEFMKQAGFEGVFKGVTMIAFFLLLGLVLGQGAIAESVAGIAFGFFIGIPILIFLFIRNTIIRSKYIHSAGQSVYIFINRNSIYFENLEFISFQKVIEAEIYQAEQKLHILRLVVDKGEGEESTILAPVPSQHQLDQILSTLVTA